MKKLTYLIILEKDIVDETTKKLLKLINEYVKINAKHFHLYYGVRENTIRGFEFFEPLDLYLHDIDERECKLETNDFNDLLDFIEDPDAYKKLKKFNI
jgi:hypothetical protein